jgi:uncharacterized protein YchJ
MKIRFVKSVKRMSYLTHLKENLVPKGAACPCGSGKKYKRCCGA